MNSNVLIYAPERQPPFQRTMFGAITLMAWMAYLYLILPLLTLVLWALGLRGAYMQLWMPAHALDPGLFIVLPLLALACAVLLTGWAEINRQRFQGQDRRATAMDATPQEVAQTLGVNHATAADLRAARIARVLTDQDAVPQNIQMSQALA